MYQLNYKNIQVCLLSFFALLVVISFTNNISDGVRNYSIFGIVVSLASWIMDSMISQEEAKVPQYWNIKINRISDKRTKNNWLLFIILVLAFLFQFLLPVFFVGIYLIFGFIYFIALKIFVYDDAEL